MHNLRTRIYKYLVRVPKLCIQVTTNNITKQQRLTNTGYTSVSRHMLLKLQRICQSKMLKLTQNDILSPHVESCTTLAENKQFAFKRLPFSVKTAINREKKALIFVVYNLLVRQKNKESIFKF